MKKNALPSNHVRETMQFYSFTPSNATLIEFTHVTLVWFMGRDLPTGKKHPSLQAKKASKLSPFTKNWTIIRKPFK